MAGDGGSKDVDNIRKEHRDPVDAENIALIDAAIDQAIKAGKENLTTNLREMKEFVLGYPGEVIIRKNSVLKSGSPDIEDQEFVLHMRKPHQFTIPTGQYGPEIIWRTGRRDSKDPLPIYSMKHGILLVKCATGQKNVTTEDLCEADLPGALHAVGSIPPGGMKIHTNLPRTESNLELQYYHVNPSASLSAAQCLRYSIDPSKTHRSWPPS